MAEKLYFVNSIHEEERSFEVQEVGITRTEKVYADQSRFEEMKIMLEDAEEESEPLIIELDLEKE